MTKRNFLPTLFTAVLLLSPHGIATAADAGKTPMTTLYVAPDGIDTWSGDARRPNTARTDGPLASLAGARDAIRKLKASGAFPGAVTVVVERGVYTMDKPFVLEPQDSGSADAPITYRGEGTDRPVISGGRALAGFQKQGALWALPVPEAANGRWSFGGLWVNGERRTLARTPNTGYFYTLGPASPLVDPATGKSEVRDTSAFRFKEGDIQNWEHPEDVQVVVLHNWEISILRIASVDMQNHVVTFTGKAPWAFTSHQRYFVQNAPGALDTPGEWYLDHQSGLLSYMPLPGEQLSKAQVVAPVAQQLVLLQGDPAAGHFVENVHFENLQFLHTDYPIEPGGHADGQAAFSVHAVIQATGAHDCSIERCVIAHSGNYGIWWRSGCQNDRTVHNELFDLGAGGVRIGEGGDPRTPAEAAGNCVVDNNYIHDNGKVFYGACGVLIARSSGNTVSHNDIGDQNYTGISVGWSWGYDPSSANHNVLEYNHIHDLGRGVLSDMGAIYSLGVSPGTIERGNVMHDIYCFPGGYGGWGVYTDEGSSNILVENNLVYNASSGPFHQHYGQDNILRNNIFAYGITTILRRTREEDHNSFTFEHNIVASNGTQFQEAGWKNDHYTIDNNLYWDYTDRAPHFFGMTLADWQKRGHDVHSVLADPGFHRHPPAEQPTFIGATREDFKLSAGSPAEQIGFKPFPTDEAGLYGEADWKSLPARTPHTRYVPVAALPQEPIEDGFENTPVGMHADGVVTNGEGGAASIRVTDEAAATGKHSLKLLDAAGLTNVWDPHFYYTVNWSSGRLQEDVDIRVERGAIVDHEWRDWRSDPYRTGPHFHVDEAGHMTVDGAAIADLPIATWVHVTLSCTLGSNAGHFDLSVKLPGEAQPRTFTDLPCSPEFHHLTWIGYTMNANRQAVMYLDNFHLRPVKK